MLTKIDNNRLKQVIIKANNAKGYLPQSLKKALQSNIHSSKVLNSTPTKITRQQAVKIVKDLHQQGLTPKITTNATEYVKNAFTVEERRQTNIKKDNIAETNKQRLAEETVAKNTTKTNDSAKPVNNTVLTQPLANANLHNKIPIAETRPNSMYGKTNLKPKSQLPEAIKKPADWIKAEDDLIDLAID